MPTVINKSQRVIIVGSYSLSPSVPQEVPGEILENTRIDEMIAAGELEIGSGSTSKEESATKEETKSAPKKSEK
jgi:hypothetical protein